MQFLVKLEEVRGKRAIEGIVNGLPDEQMHVLGNPGIWFRALKTGALWMRVHDFCDEEVWRMVACDRLPSEAEYAAKAGAVTGCTHPAMLSQLR